MAGLVAVTVAPASPEESATRPADSSLTQGIQSAEANIATTTQILVNLCQLPPQ
jgi:hypothetical protein